MKIGFIGAGKMGFTLGKHFTEYAKRAGQPKDWAVYPEVVGYYSKNPESARQAAEFTDTKYYEKWQDLVEKCDALFLTVPDGQIAITAKMLDGQEDVLKGKILCHTSGALSSQVFSGMGSRIYGYSIHPIYAVNSKMTSYINFSDSFITIEGNEKYLDKWVTLFENLGHQVKCIGAKDKVKYHCSAVFSSNLVIGVYHMATELLCGCGFSETEALEALKPLFRNNAENLIKTDCERALTGPVERCDVETVQKHLDTLSGEWEEVYRLLSRELVKIASAKEEKDYDTLLRILDQRK